MKSPEGSPEESHDETVLLGRAPNPTIAGLWVSMLEAAGIVAHVPGTYLADDWAISQRVMGNIGADVYVLSSRLAEARSIIAKHPLEPERED
jgi:hypothetical protein